MALRAIVSDPAYGSDALANPRILAGLLGDLLPDAPRESGLLLAAAEKDVPAALRDHVRHGMDIGTAISLTASSLAASTAFGPEVCEGVTTEFAIALDLGIAEQPLAPPQAAADPPKQALSASGDAVSVRALAYETDGAVQKYAFSYDVQAGVIVSGHSTLIASG